jgi:ankyrin repeat protein
MLLLSKGEPINVNVRDYDNYTPLHHASIYGHTGIVRQLLDSNAGKFFSFIYLFIPKDVNVTSTLGFTPLHCAALGGHGDIVTLLLERNENVNAIDSTGFSG